MKNLLLSLAMLLVSSSMFAQLYVTPNATSSTDSYIYVDDEVLFVEQDINLVENTNDPTTEASIYLRNESQLIQGTTGSTNAGTGYISVMQNSNSDAYDYTYWSSPVGASNATGNQYFGLGRVNDSLSNTNSQLANTTSGYNGWSSPLTISTRWGYRWNPTTQRWLWNGTANVVPPGRGFIMKGTDVTVHGDPFNDPNNQIYDFRGRPNNGDITVPTRIGVAAADGVFHDYTLTGNPYPSALDLNELFYGAGNSEIDSFRFWDEDRSINSHLYLDNKGGYGTWVPLVEDDTNPGFYTRPTFYNYDNGGGQGGATGMMGPIIERRFAPVGQGFMIKANATGSITIRNDYREYVVEGVGNNSQFRNPLGNNSSATVVIDNTQNTENIVPQIRVVTVFGDNSHMRDMGLLFHESSTDGYDRGMDAKHPMDAAKAEAYFKIGETPDTHMNLVIQTIPFADDKRVQIAFALDEETKFFVSVEEQINTPFVQAYLFDSLNNSYQEITDNNKAGLFLPAGTYEDRFYITFRGIEQDRQNDPIVIAQNDLKANIEFFQDNRVAKLEVSNPEGYDIKTVNIFDMNGKLVLTQENLGTQRRLSFPTANFSDGIYLVKLTTVDNFAIDYKITVFNK